MEIIFEILSAIFGALLETLFEVLAQAVFEVAAEIGLRALSEPFQRPEPINPFLAGLGYFLYGSFVGGLSLLIPRIFIAPLWLRLINLAVTPVVCGFIMAKLGRSRERQGQRTIRIDRFLYGYLFALAMAVVRFIWR